VLPLSIKRLNVAGLSLALSDEGCVLRHRLLEIGLGIDLHHSNLLIGVDDKLLGVGFGLVDLSDGIGLDLINNNLLHTLSVGDEDRRLLLGLGLSYLLVGVGLELFLFLVDLGSCDLLLQLIQLPLVDSLQVCKLLLLLVVQSKLLVFLLFFVIF